MKSLAERHADRIKRKAENEQGVALGGNPSDEENTFIEGEHGFSRAGVGVINRNFVLGSDDPAQVNDTLGQIDPIVGGQAQDGVDAAQASQAEQAEQAAAWGTTGGSAGTAAQSGGGGGSEASGAEGAQVAKTTGSKAK